MENIGKTLHILKALQIMLITTSPWRLPTVPWRPHLLLTQSFFVSPLMEIFFIVNFKFFARFKRRTTSRDVLLLRASKASSTYDDEMMMSLFYCSEKVFLQPWKAEQKIVLNDDKRALEAELKCAVESRCHNFRVSIVDNSSIHRFFSYFSFVPRVPREKYRNGRVRRYCHVEERVGW